MVACTSSRLWRDEAGVSSVELIVLLVLIVAVGVSLWNVFGHDVGCRLRSATDALDRGEPLSAQCRDAVSDSGSVPRRGSTASGQRTSGSSSAPVQAEPSPSGTTTAGLPPGVPPAESSSWFGNPVTGAAGGLVQARTSMPYDPNAGYEASADLLAGTLAGLAPFTPLMPSKPEPLFGHDIAFGLGEAAGSLIGMGLDYGSMGLGYVGYGLATVGGPITPATLAASYAMIAGGAAGLVGHEKNFGDAIDHIGEGAGEWGGERPEPGLREGGERGAEPPREPAPKQPSAEPSPPVRNENGGVDFADSADLYPVEQGQKNTVRVQYTGSRRSDFKAANEAAGFESNGGKAPSLHGEDYTWHHLDDYDPVTNTGTMQLVRRDAHEATYPHTGGVKMFQDATGKKYKR